MLTIPMQAPTTKERSISFNASGILVKASLIRKCSRSLHSTCHANVARALSIEEVRLRVLLYSQWSVVANTPATVVRAIDLQSQFGISFWDALIVGAASTSGADILYSEDLSDSNVYGSVRVVNPFK